MMNLQDSATQGFLKKIELQEIMTKLKGHATLLHIKIDFTPQKQ